MIIVIVIIIVIITIIIIMIIIIIIIIVIIVILKMIISQVTLCRFYKTTLQVSHHDNMIILWESSFFLLFLIQTLKWEQ